MNFCVFTAFVRGCVRPPGLIAPRRTAIPQRDGVRQPMNEPTKVVSSSSLHSSFKAVTCLILIAEGGDIWQLCFKHMSSSVCACVCVFACVCVCVCVSCEENCCSTGCWWGSLFQVKATDTVQSNSNSPNRFPHTYRGCSHYSPAISAPFLATGNLAFYLPAPLVKIQISRLDETEWGKGGGLECGRARLTCFCLGAVKRRVLVLHCVTRQVPFQSALQYNATLTHAVLNPLNPPVFFPPELVSPHETTNRNFSANCEQINNV